MRIEVVFLPQHLKSGQLEGRTVVVFDVLRATTSITAALASGVKEIRVFGDVDSAASARRDFAGSALLCGEVNTLPPAGFDLGNSPPAFTPSVCSGKTLFISTTNGTKAILAAGDAAEILVGALVNAAAVARAAAETGRPITLLCSGTGGLLSYEDAIGCGAVVAALDQTTAVVEDSDGVLMARSLFARTRADLPTALRQSRGGHNIIRVGLTPDIDFCAALDRYDNVGRVVAGDPPTVVPIAAIT